MSGTNSITARINLILLTTLFVCSSYAMENKLPTALQQDLDQIRSAFETNRTTEALHKANELSKLHKNDPELHLSLGVLLASESQYKPAQFELEQADALKPGTFAIPYSLGQTLLLEGKYPQAESALSRALKLQPDSPQTMYLLAQVLAHESRPMDALALLVHAHKLAAQNTDIVWLMAQITISQNYIEDAIPLLESGVSMAPERMDLRAALGECYLMSDRLEKAVDQFKTVVAVKPSAQAYALLGLVYQRLGRYDEAKQDYEQGLKLDAHNLACSFNLGLIAQRQGSPAAAQIRFEEVLRLNANYPDALLELANLMAAEKRFSKAEELLKRYVKVSRNPAGGYYKLAMVERSLHEAAAADRDLNMFQTLSKNVSGGQFPNEHLYDFLDNRTRLAPEARAESDIEDITAQLKQHPDQPQGLYLLAEAYLRAAKVEEAKNTLALLDKLSENDSKTLAGTGVLLARYHLLSEAIAHFQKALAVSPDSPEINFDLANAYFHKRLYAQALDAAQQVSEEGRKDDAYLALLGDIYAHLGKSAQAEQIYGDAIARNPDNDQDYLALALLQFREHDMVRARQTLQRGQARVPGSGKIAWGLGLASALEGNTSQAEDHFQRAVELLPEWPGGYSTLGIFYFETGQIPKAKEVLNRFKNSSESAVLDINRIEQVLDQAPATTPAVDQPMAAATRQQFLAFALSLADKTL